MIPREVIGKFSLRIVPSQTPDDIKAKVTDYLMKLHKESGSTCDISLDMGHGGLPWVADINDPNFVAGREAIKEVFKVDPDFTREGNTFTSIY